MSFLLVAHMLRFVVWERRTTAAYRHYFIYIYISRLIHGFNLEKTFGCHTLFDIFNTFIMLLSAARFMFPVLVIIVDLHYYYY